MTSPAAWTALRAIDTYRFFTSWRPTPCRYVPTCSHFGSEAIELHGFVRGGWLTVRRLGRCTPWSSTNGWDPVPKPGMPDSGVSLGTVPPSSSAESPSGRASL